MNPFTMLSVTLLQCTALHCGVQLYTVVCTTVHCGVQLYTVVYNCTLWLPAL